MRNQLLILVALSLLCLSNAIVSPSSSSYHRREDVNDENPHPNPSFSWSDLKVTDWTPQHMVDWLRFKLSGFVPATGLHPSKLASLETQKQSLLDKFRSYDWKQTHPVNMLKSRLGPDSDLRRHINMIENEGLRDYLSNEFHTLIDKYDTRGILHDVEEDGDKSFMSSVSAAIMSVLMFPFTAIASILSMVGSAFLTIFELMGLVLMYVAFFSPNVTEHSLLNSADGIFHHTSHDFFGLVDSKILESRTRSTHSTALALLFAKVLIGAPVLFLGGPLFYMACVSWVLYRVLTSQNQYQKIIPGLFALFVGYFVIPKWIWTPISWTLWRIGDYGMILMLYHAYSLILPFLASQRNKVQRQFAEEGAEISQKASTSTEGAVPSKEYQQQSQSHPKREDQQLRQMSQQVPHTDISKSSTIGSDMNNMSSNTSTGSSNASKDFSQQRASGVVDTTPILEKNRDPMFPHSATQQHTSQTVGFGRGS